jgi:hypothetical protein
MLTLHPVTPRLIDLKTRFAVYGTFSATVDCGCVNEFCAVKVHAR